MASPATANQLDAVKERINHVVNESLEERRFASGSRGYWVQSRETIGGVKFMFNIQAIVVGSKNEKE